MLCYIQPEKTVLATPLYMEATAGKPYHISNKYN